MRNLIRTRLMSAACRAGRFDARGARPCKLPTRLIPSPQRPDRASSAAQISRNEKSRVPQREVRKP